MKNEAKLKEIVKEKLEIAATGEDVEKDFRAKLEEIQRKKLEKIELEKSLKMDKEELEKLEKIQEKKSNSQKIKELKQILEKNKKKLEQVSSELGALETGAIKVAAMILSDVKTAGELIIAASKKEDTNTRAKEQEQKVKEQTINSVAPGEKIEEQKEKKEEDKTDIVHNIADIADMDLIELAQKYKDESGLDQGDVTSSLIEQAQKIKKQDEDLYQNLK